MQGKSLVPVLKEKTPADWRKSIYYHYFEFPSYHMVAKHYGIRTERYKLIRFYEFDEWEFYDLKTDPDEKLNQYSNPDYDSEIQRLKEELVELRLSYGDTTDVTPKPIDWREKHRSAQKRRQ